ncbi:Ferredoxin-thioredoxin reductase catalytic chain, chloroplastic [Dichanthelium oligosanthes]|uniref:Ferredoxin-thioredoxin reductase catalytic chain, chloroplastic n=1 Tax=Dichanthelium oligosanthes TaxID=888268 RepID=A0A1E5VD31_9POAL|nr:Ferredoxin-thioredoxin reductase catalytic chain, chloroplastic [Dichanthelium oligosanthes]
MTSTVATTVGCGGLPFRPSSTAPRPRGRWVVRAQAAGADASDDKSVEIMRKFSEQYARRSNTFFCADKSVTAVVIKGLADHKDTLGAPLCPCRHYDDKAAEAAQGFWNCPCVPMRERCVCELYFRLFFMMVHRENVAMSLFYVQSSAVLLQYRKHHFLCEWSTFAGKNATVCFSLLQTMISLERTRHVISLDEIKEATSKF